MDSTTSATPTRVRSTFLGGRTNARKKRQQWVHHYQIWNLNMLAKVSLSPPILGQSIVRWGSAQFRPQHTDVMPVNQTSGRQSTHRAQVTNQVKSVVRKLPLTVHNFGFHQKSEILPIFWNLLLGIGDPPNSQNFPFFPEWTTETPNQMNFGW